MTVLNGRQGSVIHGQTPEKKWQELWGQRDVTSLRVWGLRKYWVLEFVAQAVRLYIYIYTLYARKYARTYVHRYSYIYIYTYVKCLGATLAHVTPEIGIFQLLRRFWGKRSCNKDYDISSLLRDIWVSVGRDSAVGIATRYGLDCPGWNPGCGETFLTRPDLSWGQPSLLYNGYRVILGGKAAGPWP